jgi:hypothetical protein
MLLPSCPNDTRGNDKTIKNVLNMRFLDSEIICFIVVWFSFRSINSRRRHLVRAHAQLLG